jgi:hypothetical protein
MVTRIQLAGERPEPVGRRNFIIIDESNPVTLGRIQARISCDRDVSGWGVNVNDGKRQRLADTFHKASGRRDLVIVCYDYS